MVIPCYKILLLINKNILGDVKLKEFKILENYPDYKIYRNGDIVSTKRKSDRLITG